MSQHLDLLFSDSSSAFNTWLVEESSVRFDVLTAFVEGVAKQNAHLGKASEFHYQQAKQLLEQAHLMPGPTGETNELYTAGRGVTLVIAEITDEFAQESTIALLTSALAAGNSVIVCSDDQALTRLVTEAASGLPANLVKTAALEDAQALTERDVRGVAYVGSQEKAQQLNLKLAQREGAIVGLVVDSDPSSRIVSRDRHLSLRFITERTRTINITAVGGNATLLELGSTPH